jgi:peptidyl-Asp metalloendopeptidase
LHWLNDDLNGIDMTTYSYRPSMLRSAFALILAVSLSACTLIDGRPTVERVEITLLAVYTDGAREAAPDVESRIRSAVAEINDIYREGEIPINLRLVHVAEEAYTMTERLQDLARLMRVGDGHLDEVHRLRNEHQADIVALVSETPGTTINGSIMARPETAFVIVYWEDLGSPRYGLAHEIGHLHGARHSPDHDPALEPFPYGHGFKNESIRTIMANGPQERVGRFSGPDQRHRRAVLGDSTLHNVARVLRETAAYVSNFRGPRTPTDFQPTGHWPTVE